MKSARRWIRGPAILGGGLALLGTIGLLSAARSAGRDLRTDTDAVLANAVAGYLSLVTPVDLAGGYDPAVLLSAASTLGSSSGWNGGLQVAWTGQALLRDPVGLLPLDPTSLVRLADGERRIFVSRPRVGTVALAPLLDRDQWETVGWIAVWGAVPPPRNNPVTLALALVAGIAIVLAAHLARPVESSRRPQIGGVLAVTVVLLLAYRLEREVDRVAATSTDVALEQSRRLMEIAATAHGVREEQLSNLAPGFRVRRLEEEPSGAEGVRREWRNGHRVAVAVASLRDGKGLELSIVPAEARLTGFLAAMGGWCLLVAGGLAFAVWAGHAQRDRRGFRETLRAWGFLGPAFAHLAICSFGPVGFAVWLAFHRWGLVEADRPFVGWENFRQVFGDPRFWHSLRVTAVYSLYVPIAMALALGAAVALDRSGLRVRLLRTILFLPFVSSVVAIALVWQWLYQPDFGLINTGLRALGSTGPDWLGDPRTALGAVMVMSVWVQTGYQMVLFLGGLQAIPEVYHDAARIDGASRWQRFRCITLPLLRPTVLFVLVTGTINSFQVFTYISVMTEGGPLYATDALVFRIYQEAWEFLRFGTASVMSLMLLVILVTLTWLQFRWLGKRVELV